jgi:hypothetical protein
MKYAPLIIFLLVLIIFNFLFHLRNNFFRFKKVREIKREKKLNEIF